MAACVCSFLNMLVGVHLNAHGGLHLLSKCQWKLKLKQSVSMDVCTCMCVHGCVYMDVCTCAHYYLSVRTPRVFTAS